MCTKQPPPHFGWLDDKILLLFIALWTKNKRGRPGILFFLNSLLICLYTWSWQTKYFLEKEKYDVHKKTLARWHRIPQNSKRFTNKDYDRIRRAVVERLWCLDAVAGAWIVW